MSSGWQNLAYLLAASMFIIGLKMMSHPRTAVRGNAIGALGMVIAIVVTLVDEDVLGTTRLGISVIVSGLILGSVIGAIMALKVRMTAMPQMVGLLNGFGGGASVLVAGAALLETLAANEPIGTQFSIATVASGLVGGVTFWGSLLAYIKLEEWKGFDKPFHFPAQQVVNAALLLLCVVVGIILIRDPAAVWAYWVLVVMASVLGITLVMAIGGADMPVVICLLNSYSGIAGAATGFVLNNNALIIAGSLVGASGIILCQIMCKAMNRSLANVLFGRFSGDTSGAKADEVYATVKSASAEEVAMLFDSARRAVIVPGYGMAVSQAQHAVPDLSILLESRGCEVVYAIHPVAGRMPGHMNVLLAEADVPYDKLKEMDEINSEIEQFDVALVIGANDTVNPIARSDANSPIAGMPIINVDKARTVVVIKRSLSPGFAGIPNPLFAAENTLMMFGDGKKAIVDLANALKAA